MSRLPYAAKTLIGQVRIAKPKAKHEPVDQPDGLGVHRSIRFSKAAAGWLEPLLREVRDARIADLSVDENDGLVVTFVSGPDADRWDTFALHEAETVIENNQRQQVSTGNPPESGRFGASLETGADRDQEADLVEQADTDRVE